MIGPDFPPSPKEGAWPAVCVGVLGSDTQTLASSTPRSERSFPFRIGGNRWPSIPTQHCFGEDIVYRLRVLGHWFDGIRFYARRVQPEEVASHLGRASVVVLLQHPLLVVRPLELEQGQAELLDRLEAPQPTTDSPSACG